MKSTIATIATLLLVQSALANTGSLVFEIKQSISGGDVHTSDLLVECLVYKNFTSYSYKKTQGAKTLAAYTTQQSLAVPKDILELVNSLDPFNSQYAYIFTKDYGVKSLFNAYVNGSSLALQSELEGERLTLDNTNTETLLKYIRSVCK